jgi:hypothetical protein
MTVKTSAKIGVKEKFDKIVAGKIIILPMIITDTKK